MTFYLFYDTIDHMQSLNSCKSDTAPGSSWGMRAVLELSKIGAIGNANLEVTGLDNLQATIKKQRTLARAFGVQIMDSVYDMQKLS